MNVVLSSDTQGLALKNSIKKFLMEKDYDLIDVTTENGNFIDSVKAIVEVLHADQQALGIAIDEFGAGSFMVATKSKNIVAAEVSDERSAYMTREHNNSRMITLGSEIVGDTLAKNIVLAFLQADYDGGRHQIRVDMLNKMC
ncbi:galactose-6-phosphate isomerase subunit LacA [Enterococcus durans]|uniref:galactose-6-phosphate isomerase subunit LacA n=1 Tax=Enterococcus durans TaxID=53345 RepID=UPI002430D7F0|nr:galactose-6-phosphate isomerase subunit LacA [Enterococcus durans]